VFYGYEIEKVELLIEKFGIKRVDFYYGGGTFGFLGIKDGCLKKDEIKKLVKEHELFNKEVEPYSYHIFMFPFMFDHKDEIIKGWKHEPYINDYNETAYFHEFFRKTMFTTSENSSSDVYSKELISNEVKMTKSKEYLLTLEKVSLRIFETGIGILSLHIKNSKHPELKSILEINDYGRRLFPEYLDNSLQCKLVPESITINGITETFCYTEKPKKPLISKIIQGFIPIDNIVPAIDDRMFVISYHKNKKLVEDLKRNYEKNSDWYEYIFVDGNGKMVQNTQMQQDLIRKSTYSRWQGAGTMYGITRYSFVCASDSDFVLEHMQGIYFQMFSLLLMVRATTLKFSGEVASIANKLEESNDGKDIRTLYQRYIKFVSRFYFREVTAKEQGIEIYEKALELLKIEREVKDLDNEIAELFSYTDMTKQAQINADVANLSRFGIPLMVMSLVAGIFGINTINFSNHIGIPWSVDWGTWSLGLIVGTGIIAWLGIKFLGGKK
jgi:Mg2+ and Co2+ transporter CorA